MRLLICILLLSGCDSQQEKLLFTVEFDGKSVNCQSAWRGRCGVNFEYCDDGLNRYCMTNVITKEVLPDYRKADQ